MPYFTNLRSKFYYWHLLVALIIVRYILLTAIFYSQHLYVSSDTVPKNLQEYLTVAQWDVLRKNSIYSFKYDFVISFMETSLHLAVVGFNLLPKTWDLLTNITNTYLVDFIAEDNSWLRSLLYYSLFHIIRMIILIAPLLVIGGGSVDAAIIWTIAIGIIAVSSEVIFVSLLYYGFFWWLHRGNKWIKTGAIMAVITTIRITAQFIISPPKIPRLPDSPLKERIISLIVKAGFNKYNLYYAPSYFNAGTKGTGQSAIMVVGGKLMNLYKGFDDQMMAVIGHELGHWNYNHALLNDLYRTFFIGIILCIYVALANRPRFYEAFDMKTADFVKYKAIPLGIGLILIEIIVGELRQFFEPVTNYIGWMKEFACDAYAVKLGMGKDIYDAMYKLSMIHPYAVANYAFALFHATHPPLSYRLSAIKKLLPS